MKSSAIIIGVCTAGMIATFAAGYQAGQKSMINNCVLHPHYPIIQCDLPEHLERGMIAATMEK